MPPVRQCPRSRVPVLSYGFAVPEILRVATMVTALVVAAWAGLAAIRDRAPRMSHLIGVAALEILAITLVGTAVVRIVNGQRAHEMVAFVGYLAAFLVIPPAGLTLARMEPSKWGSVIIAAVGLVEAVLVVRLQQVWTGIG